MLIRRKRGGYFLSNKYLFGLAENRGGRKTDIERPLELAFDELEF